MITILDALYNWAQAQPNETQWLHDADMAREYAESEQFMEQHSAALEERLSGRELTAFQRYKENRDFYDDLRSEIVFAQGVSIGITLGTLRP